MQVTDDCLLLCLLIFHCVMPTDCTKYYTIRKELINIKNYTVSLPYEELLLCGIFRRLSYLLFKIL